MSEPITLKLAQPITVAGTELAVITLRRPTGKDVREIGLPYTTAMDGGNVSLAMGPVCRYVGRLAQLPPSTVDLICPSDLNTLAWTVAGFFLGGAGAATPMPTQPD